MHTLVRTHIHAHTYMHTQRHTDTCTRRISVTPSRRLTRREGLDFILQVKGRH